MSIIYNETMRILNQCYKEGWRFKMMPQGVSVKTLNPIFEWCNKTYGCNRQFLSPMMFGDDYRWIAANINSGQGDAVEEFIVGFKHEKDLTLFLLKWGEILNESRYLHT
jgi:hypothetical protein